MPYSVKAGLATYFAFGPLVKYVCGESGAYGHAGNNDILIMQLPETAEDGALCSEYKLVFISLARNLPHIKATCEGTPFHKKQGLARYTSYCLLHLQCS